MQSPPAKARAPGLPQTQQLPAPPNPRKQRGDTVPCCVSKDHRFRSHRLLGDAGGERGTVLRHSLCLRTWSTSSQACGSPRTIACTFPMAFVRANSCWGQHSAQQLRRTTISGHLRSGLGLLLTLLREPQLKAPAASLLFTRTARPPSCSRDPLWPLHALGLTPCLGAFQMNKNEVVLFNRKKEGMAAPVLFPNYLIQSCQGRPSG